MPKKIDLTGKRIGRLIVVREADRGITNNIQWLCRCDCGNEKVVGARSIHAKQIVSCGCYARERQLTSNLTHGHTAKKQKMRAYNIWKGMRSRCNNPKIPNYHRYGGRGIKVCERWNDFEKFLEDMGHPPDGHSIDRIDNDKGYTPENCRWADTTTQIHNSTSVHKITFNGKTQILADWAKELGIAANTLSGRIKRCGSAEAAIAQGGICGRN